MHKIIEMMSYWTVTLALALYEKKKYLYALLLTKIDIHNAADRDLIHIDIYINHNNNIPSQVILKTYVIQGSMCKSMLDGRTGRHTWHRTRDFDTQ